MRSWTEFWECLTGPKVLRRHVVMVIGENPAEDVDDRRVALVAVESPIWPTPRVHVAASEFAEYGDVHYGLGFRSRSYRGERVVWHGGGWTGTTTLMTMLPDRGVGVAVFTNSNMKKLRIMLRCRFL
jgi:CubicO group peptidase (beta-lactamase class C family)